MTNNRLLGAVSLAVLAAGCGYHDWHGEAFRHRYPGPSKETGQQLVERQAIMHWKANPRDKKRIGYLEQYEILLAGSRDPHDIYYIRDAAGIHTLGYISENGVFFRYTPDGQAERVGEYPIRDVGIRVFYNLPKSDNLGFEDIPLFDTD